MKPPTYEDVLAASARLDGQAHRTPVLTSRLVDAELGAQVFLKAENLQRMGAFKFRGAFNALSRLGPAERGRGVVAFSSGNHAQAVALAGALLDVPTTIVMPLDAPAAKVAATNGYGGRIVEYDRYSESRDEIAQDLAEKHGLTVIPPFDHPDVIAGQGSATKELHEEVAGLDALFVPLGGGGLLSGAILATKVLAPDCEIYGVEPEAGNDGQLSLERGQIVHIDVPRTIADGAQTQHLGALTFDVIRSGVNAIVTATDDELVECMGVLASRLKSVVEPTGCLGFAAARRMAAQFAGRRIAVILSGGNVDMHRFGELLNPGATDSIPTSKHSHAPDHLGGFGKDFPPAVR